MVYGGRPRLCYHIPLHVFVYHAEPVCWALMQGGVFMRRVMLMCERVFVRRVVYLAETFRTPIGDRNIVFHVDL